MIKIGYSIEQQETAGLFIVTNRFNKEVYEVDINTPDCSCKKFKYTKKNKAGIKKPCKHIKMCKGIKIQKI